MIGWSLCLTGESSSADRNAASSDTLIHTNTAETPTCADVCQAAGRPALPYHMWEASAAGLESSSVLGSRHQADRYSRTTFISQCKHTQSSFCMILIPVYLVWLSQSNGTTTTQTSGQEQSRTRNKSAASLIRWPSTRWPQVYAWQTGHKMDWHTNQRISYLHLWLK